jgi:hypothetical protein
VPLLIESATIQGVDAGWRMAGGKHVPSSSPGYRSPMEGADRRKMGGTSREEAECLSNEGRLDH